MQYKAKFAAETIIQIGDLTPRIPTTSAVSSGLADILASSNDFEVLENHVEGTKDVEDESNKSVGGCSILLP